MAGVDRLYAPGDLGEALGRDYSINGIPLNRETLAGLQSAAEMAGANIVELETVIAGQTGTAC